MWTNNTTSHVFCGDDLVKTHPVTLTSADLGRLVGREERPAPVNALPAGGRCPPMPVVEVDRIAGGIRRGEARAPKFERYVPISRSSAALRAWAAAFAALPA